jgi:hypothetical protein
MPDGIVKRRQGHEGTLKEDIFLLHGMADDTYGQIIGLVQFLQESHGQLQKLVQDLAAIRAAETNVASELTLIHSQAEANSNDLEAMQQTIESSAMINQDNTIKHNRILADMVDILREVMQAEDSIQAAIVGLTRQMHDHPCPWSQTDEHMTAEDRMEAMNVIAGMAPDLHILTQRILDREGFEPSPHGPKPKYWAKKVLDMFKEAFVAVIFSTLATMLFGWLILKFSGNLEPGRDVQVKQLQEQIQTMQRELNEKDGALLAARMELIEVRKRATH